jgi:hypothetical protein
LIFKLMVSELSGRRDWVSLRPCQKNLSPLIAAAMVLAGSAHANEPAPFPEIMAITERMGSFVKSGEIAGAVTLVADAGKTIHISSVGMADIGTGKPMTPDAVFWIASMTKPITATAVMMMQEAGLLSVERSVSKYLPEFTTSRRQGGHHDQAMPDPQQRPERGHVARNRPTSPRCRADAPDRREAGEVSTRQQVAVLPDRHQHRGARRRGGLRQDRFPSFWKSGFSARSA